MNIFDAMRSGELIEIVGAHDCLSARIGLAAGFDAVWASSLGLSTVAARRDRNELSWTELVDAAGEIAGSVDAPVILDANEGYGHNEIAKLITVRAKGREIIGLSLEDKRFPKINSHEPGVELLDCADSVSRIQSCCEVAGSGFFVIGRTDALIAGRSVEEAIDRAEAYSHAGASAVIVHSRAETFEELREFMTQWSGRCPVLIIPTTFGSTSRLDYRRSGVGGIIWANQLMRSAIFSMMADASRLHADGNSALVSEHLASLETTFVLSESEWRSAMGAKASE